jgi:hypothetical protein
MLAASREGMPMDLQATIVDVLRASSHAMTFENVVRGVAQRLEDDIRAKLNELADKDQIQRHPGGRNHLWRYQATPMKPLV